MTFSVSGADYELKAVATHRTAGTIVLAMLEIQRAAMIGYPIRRSQVPEPEPA